MLERKIVASVRRRGDDPPQHFSQTILDTYYQLECNQKFQSNYTKNQIKRAHEVAIARFNELGEEY